MISLLKKTLILAVVLVACGGTASSEVVNGEGHTEREDLPSIGAEEFDAKLATIEEPAVVNVWASWCLPCRAEAPLLNDAFAEYGDEVRFIGVDVQDNQSDAKEFLAEFGLDFDHYFDRNRAIPNFYGGIGTPITMFFGPNGELATIHNGILDERTLTLNIEEILALAP